MKLMNELRIIFMGTPEFAVASLSALLDAGCNIVAVVTAPDKPSGRGMQLNASAVKKFSLEKGLTVLQPEKLKNPDFIQQLRLLEADLQIVVAFRMLPEIVWNMPPLGTINVHGSLLPQYRGAAPINWAIINGEKETGVTTFKLVHEIDRGNILMREKITIGENETAGELHDRMKLIGASLLVKTIEGISKGELTETEQEHVEPDALKHAPKIFTEHCRINFNRDTVEVHNLIRGLSPFPGAFTTINDKLLKIFRTSKHIKTHDKTPGILESDNKTFLRFWCLNGFVEVLEMQLEGKRKMSVEEFLRGNKLIQ
jgi:methionyl-tRNA formyltransferase